MWQEENNKLKKTFAFKDFDEAFKFITVAAEKFKDLNHHPFWCNNYNIVSFSLFTHSAGNIVTDKDRKLAKILDTLFQDMKKRAA